LVSIGIGNDEELGIITFVVGNLYFLSTLVSWIESEEWGGEGDQGPG
jgi:hypothetical protein